MKISVVINTYNGEKFLCNVLDSVKEFDEVLICDMHSTDNTVEIANRYNTKIVYYPGENLGYPEPARNFAIQSAKNEWVLLIDQDEVVTEKLKDTLVQFVNQNSNAAAFSVPRKNYFMGKFMHAAFPDYLIRFFRKDKIDWPKEIHAIPKINGEVVKLPINQDYALEHLADDSISDILKKMDRYTNAEITRRGAKNLSYLKLIFSPMFRFIKHYFIKKGFLDGKAGFIFAMTKAHYKFYTLAKMSEKTTAHK